MAVSLSSAIAWAVAGRAVAEERAEPVRFQYSAPDTCPNEAEFIREVGVHTSRFRIAGEAEQARTFQITLEETDPGSITGNLVVLDEGAELAKRSIRAESCNEAAEALAFITALSIDPRAESAPTALPSARGTDAAAQPPTVAPTQAPRSASGERLGAATRTAGRSQWSGGLGVEVLGLATPDVVIGLRAVVGWRWDTDRLVSPAVRLSILRSFDTSVVASATRSSFSWTFGRLEVSPLRLGSRLSGELAPFVDFGVLTGEGSGTTHTFSPTSPWITVGALGRVAFRPIRHVILEGYGGGLLPLFRKTFYYDALPGSSSLQAYTPPPAAPCGGIDAAVLFP
jgi:hypothetical protein